MKLALPGGRSQTHHKQQITRQSTCVLCGQPIAGTKTPTVAKMRKLNRTKKRVWRLYGGNVCHNCLKNALKSATRTT